MEKPGELENGTIRWYDGNKKCGLIEADDRTHVLFTRKSCGSSVRIYSGERVKFRKERGRRGKWFTNLVFREKRSETPTAA